MKSMSLAVTVGALPVIVQPEAIAALVLKCMANMATRMHTASRGIGGLFDAKYRTKPRDALRTSWNMSKRQPADTVWQLNTEAGRISQIFDEKLAAASDNK